MISNFSWFPEIFISPGGTPNGKKIIDEHHAMPNKTIISNGHQLANKTVRLNFTLFADRNVFLNFNKWTNECVVANCTTVNIDRLNHFYIGAEFHILNG